MRPVHPPCNPSMHGAHFTPAFVAGITPRAFPRRPGVMAECAEFKFSEAERAQMQAYRKRIQRA